MKSDTAVYRNESNGQIAATYVDDVLTLTELADKTNDLHNQLEETLELKKGGFPNFFVGVAIRKTKDGISISQTGYVEDILESIEMEECRTVCSPMELGAYEIAKLAKEETHLKLTHQYGSLIGKYNYLAMQSRPDIAFAHALWARFMSKPTNE